MEGPEVSPGLHTMQEACQALELSPRTLRRLLQALDGLVPTRAGPPGGPRWMLPPEGLSVLTRAVRLLRQGLSLDQVRAWMESEPGLEPLGPAVAEHAAARGALPLAPGSGLEAALRAVWARLDDAVRSLADAQAAWARDRDRLLTALARTHQELRFLRYELASGRPRRLRRRGESRRNQGV
ncbi:MAG: MerR family transcriptional regulator [Acetobacteraceae bacterium]|nr:MerR family transcriptional regulator [Acetobacteraceae bacterium]